VAVVGEPGTVRVYLPKTGVDAMSDDVMGLPLLGVPDGATPLAAFVVLKMLDACGSVVYVATATEDVATVEAIGMGIYGVDRLRDEFRDD
jgi:hypothetical protein